MVLHTKKKELKRELNILESRYDEEVNKVLRKADQMKEELKKAIDLYESNPETRWVSSADDGIVKWFEVTMQKLQ